MEGNHKLVLALFLILVVILLYLGMMYNIVILPVVGPILNTTSTGKLTAPQLGSGSGSGSVSKPVEKKPYDEMSEAEKIDELIVTYFKPEVDSENKESKIEENNYINELPRNSECKDNYIDCKKWASNGECVINPEFMVYNCKSSCESCDLTPQQLYNVTTIYNNRDSPGCAFHGYSYPDPLAFRMDVFNS